MSDERRHPSGEPRLLVGQQPSDAEPSDDTEAAAPDDPGEGSRVTGTTGELGAGDTAAADPAMAGTAPGGDGGDEAGASGPRSHLRRRKHRPLPWIVIVVIAVAIAAVVRIFFVQTFYVPSPSMEPTLQPGDRMLVLKTGYTITRGAVLVFRHPPLDTRCGPGDDDLVKRVIGLPGEWIWSQGNAVYINGKVLPEPWLPKHDPMGPTPIPKQKIPPNHYYMLGDNRAESCDSRYWGPLPRSLVVGRVFLVIWRDGHPVFDVI